MFVSDGHVILDILLIRSNYDGREASQKVRFRVNAATPHGKPPTGIDFFQQLCVYTPRRWRGERLSNQYARWGRFKLISRTISPVCAQRRTIAGRSSCGVTSQVMVTYHSLGSGTWAPTHHSSVAHSTAAPHSSPAATAPSGTSRAASASCCRPSRIAPNGRNDVSR